MTARSRLALHPAHTATGSQGCNLAGPLDGARPQAHVDVAVKVFSIEAQAPVVATSRLTGKPLGPGGRCAVGGEHPIHSSASAGYTSNAQAG